MSYENRWQVIRKLGEGGQGQAYLVIDREEWKVFKKEWDQFFHELNSLDVESEQTYPLLLYKSRTKFLDIISLERPPKECVLKVLHGVQNGLEEEQAKARILREILAMRNITHPNLIKIIDNEQDDFWFVSQYYEKGILTDHLDYYAGDILKTLNALIPLVEAVAGLHKNGIVHRDIKPDNIFIGANNNLVLGDFGLVYFSDPKMKRLSNSLENVGSRDWMPMWAQGAKIEDIKPSFDVFSLGKILWAMISGKKFLRAWYFENNEFNLEELHPESLSISLLNPILKKCIVEHEKDCLTDAGKLLWYLKQLRIAVMLNGEKVKPKSVGRCKICGIGKYYCTVNKNDDITNFGINPRGFQRYRLFTCGNCGNVQLFSSPTQDKDFPAWND